MNATRDIYKNRKKETEKSEKKQNLVLLDCIKYWINHTYKSLFSVFFIRFDIEEDAWNLVLKLPTKPNRNQ